MTKRTYTANADGWIAGVPVKAGDTVQLTKEEAKYENVTLSEEGVEADPHKPMPPQEEASKPKAAPKTKAAPKPKTATDPKK